MRSPLSRHARRLFAALFAATLCCAFSHRAAAQSTDIAYPAPVFSNEIAGRISPRDVGDARLTRHFYLFKGTEGDVTLTVESAQLNGDVDLFVAKTLRPLLKVTMFGGTSATRATKSIYLRREETLILRVEARAVGDAEGSYRVLLGGSFAPAPPELAQQSTPETPTLTPEPTRRPGTRRVTSTGARIDEPPAAVAEATPTPEPSVEAARNEETPPAPARTTRRGRNTRGATNRRRAPAATPTPTPSEPSADETAARPADDAPKTDDAKPVDEGRPADGTSTNAPAATRPATPTRRRAPRNTNRRRAPSTPPSDPASSSAASSSTDAATTTTPPPVVTATRLVILTKDGQTLERAMDGVRRVTVENNQVVVTLKDGKVLRTPLANVEKMSIEP